MSCRDGKAAEYAVEDPSDPKYVLSQAGREAIAEALELVASLAHSPEPLAVTNKG